ncbi:hypothetical protein D3C76_948760 [compost metagenome]
MQPRAQRDLLEQVEGNAAGAVLGVVEGQRRQRSVDQHADAGVGDDPGFFFGGQGGEVALQQQAGVATAPAAQDVQAFAFADARQRLVDQLLQARVVTGQGKGKRPGGNLAEVVDLQCALVTLANREVGTDGIAQVGVGLAQFDGGQPGQGRAIQAQLRLGVQAADAAGRQVMIDHGQAQAGEVGGVLQAVPLAGDDDRQVVGVARTEAELCIRCLEGVGAAQQVDTAVA